MKDAFLKDENLEELLKGMGEQYSVLAPVKTPQGDRMLADPEEGEVELKSGPPLSTAKNPFLPQSETLLKFSNDQWKVTEHGDTGELPFALFGIPTCDLKAINILDEFFSGEYDDSYYKRRRAESLLIGYSCLEPPESCFCNLTDSGPFPKEDFDWRMTSLTGGYLIEAGSTRGKKALKRFRKHFIPPTTSFSEQADKLRNEALSAMPDSDCLERAFERIDSQSPENKEIWEELGERCQRCGGCNFLCPTCSCFDVSDRDCDEDCVRIRKWDSCLFEGFTRMSGGHNPQETPDSRIERRILDKIYIPMVEKGYYDCTGCGRCSETCPANIHILPAVKSLASGEDYKPDVDI